MLILKALLCVGDIHLCVCLTKFISTFMPLPNPLFASLSLSVIHFLPGRVRERWQVSGIDAALR